MCGIYKIYMLLYHKEYPKLDEWDLWNIRFCITKETIVKNTDEKWEKNLYQLDSRWGINIHNTQMAEISKYSKIIHLINKQTNGLNRWFSKEEIQMFNRYILKCSMLLPSRGNLN